MITEYRCQRCRRLLFTGSLRLLLAKKPTDDNTIEIWCDKCGYHNRFTCDPTQHVEKSDDPKPESMDMAR